MERNKVISTEEFFKNKIRENYYNKSEFDLKQFTINADEISRWSDEYAKYYATECIKYSLDKSSEIVGSLMTDIDEISIDQYEEIKNSITNIDNIVLL